MTIKLSQPFAPNGAVDEFDVRQMKKVLNRLGYYQPFEKTGITGIPDTGIFEALKKFQRDQGLPTTGTAKPDDDTIKRLNQFSQKEPDGFYIWRTVEDGKVRAAHAQYNRTVRAWADAPDPGDDFNWAEFVTEEAYAFLKKWKISPNVQGAKIAITPEQFFKEYRGYREEQITKGKTDRLLFTHPNDMKKPNTRFVKLKNGREVDMIHFMVVGRLGKSMGYINELQQLLRGSKSAFNLQDLYSNNLGVDFFEKYEQKIQNHPTEISTYIYEYLNSTP